VGEMREVDSRVLPLAHLADRPESLDQFRSQASVFCAVPASHLRTKHDPCRNLPNRSWVPGAPNLHAPSRPLTLFENAGRGTVLTLRLGEKQKNHRRAARPPGESRCVGSWGCRPKPRKFYNAFDISLLVR
jgi:hypothetical protein